MWQLDIDIDWVGSTTSDLGQATLAALTLIATEDGQRIPITEVEDTIAATVRRQIYVDVHQLACWLVTNWWRLRWEPGQKNPSLGWMNAHSLAAISGDFAWPALQISSDGESIELGLRAESVPDVSAIRYLRNLDIHISADHFESAINSLVDKVENRLFICAPTERTLHDLKLELQEEKANPELARICRYQALAGIDPGIASDQWLHEVEQLAQQIGPKVMDEILPAIATSADGLAKAEELLDAMRASPTTVCIDRGLRENLNIAWSEIPWVRGAMLARVIRKRLGLAEGPLGNDQLGEILNTAVPLPVSRWDGSAFLQGGYREDSSDGIRVLVTKRRSDSQRFYLARLLGCALMFPADERVIPVSRTYTALQKAQRAFAQELLCPWADLDEFTDIHGTDEDAITEVAEQYDVSERLIETALANRKKIPRERLDWC